MVLIHLVRARNWNVPGSILKILTGDIQEAGIYIHTCKTDPMFAGWHSYSSWSFAFMMLSVFLSISSIFYAK